MRSCSKRPKGRLPDAHAVGVAVLSALRALGDAAAPLLVAVDDVQWLDTASAGALAYAARRLRGEPRRRSARAPRGARELARRRAPPVARRRALCRGRRRPARRRVRFTRRAAQLDVALPRPLLAEVHQASGGNPFYALEIVRTLRALGRFGRGGPAVARAASRSTSSCTAACSRCPRRAATSSSPLRRTRSRRSRSPRQHRVSGARTASRRRSRRTSSSSTASASVSRIRCSRRVSYEIGDAASSSRDSRAPRGARSRIRKRVRGSWPRRREQPDEAVARVARGGARPRAHARGAPRPRRSSSNGRLRSRPRRTQRLRVAAASRRRTPIMPRGTPSVRGRCSSRRSQSAVAGPERAGLLVALARFRSYDDDLRGASSLYEQALDEAQDGSLVAGVCPRRARWHVLPTARTARRGGRTSRRRRRALRERSGRRSSRPRPRDEGGVRGVRLAVPRRPDVPRLAARARHARALDRPVLRQPEFAAGASASGTTSSCGAHDAYEAMAVAAQRARGRELAALHARHARPDRLRAAGVSTRPARGGEGRRSPSRPDSGRSSRTRSPFGRSREAHLGRADEATRRPLGGRSSSRGRRAGCRPGSSRRGRSAISRSPRAIRVQRIETLASARRAPSRVKQSRARRPSVPARRSEALVDAGRSTRPRAARRGTRQPLSASRARRRSPLHALPWPARRRAGDLEAAIAELEAAARAVTAQVDMPLDALARCSRSGPRSGE